MYGTKNSGPTTPCQVKFGRKPEIRNGLHLLRTECIPDCTARSKDSFLGIRAILTPLGSAMLIHAKNPRYQTVYPSSHRVSEKTWVLKRDHSKHGSNCPLPSLAGRQISNISRQPNPQKCGMATRPSPQNRQILDNNLLKTSHSPKISTKQSGQGI